MERHCYFGHLPLIPLIPLILASAVQAGAQAAPDAILNKFGQSVFTVNAYSRMSPDERDKASQQNPRWRINVGTAFPIGVKDYLITVSDVLRDTQKIRVVDADGKEYKASVVGYDATEQISVLKFQRNSKLAPPPVCPVEEVKSSGKVVLLGSPSGGNLSAIPGNISSVNHPDGAVVVTVAGEPGTSGTPVFDEQGRVIGLLAYHLEGNSPAGDTGGRSYLVLPMEYATLLAQSIINRYESRNGWLGISTSLSGLKVVEVIKGSPAERCGIKPGDRVTKFNDSTVETPEDLVRVMGSTHPGDTVRIRVLRGAETLPLTTKLVGHPSAR